MVHSTHILDMRNLRNCSIKLWISAWNCYHWWSMSNLCCSDDNCPPLFFYYVWHVLLVTVMDISCFSLLSIIFPSGRNILLTFERIPFPVCSLSILHWSLISNPSANSFGLMFKLCPELIPSYYLHSYHCLLYTLFQEPLNWSLGFPSLALYNIFST